MRLEFFIIIYFKADALTRFKCNNHCATRKPPKSLHENQIDQKGVSPFIYTAIYMRI